MNKEEYWKQRPNNIGSKRKKSFTTNITSIINRSIERLRKPDIRNTKKHRDLRTKDKGEMK